ncbi:EamA family transporter RarD [Chromohalobacter sp. 48-RD10]|uniref:EamA family transporter RarD n=1 Tax=Chromohalobacter sp. 48-RD10 TaxID=2994063 RepID=UPI0024682482|nr:EamA family transporter RarD [Chromohalobacter sp. 48-RD10]
MNTTIGVTLNVIASFLFASMFAYTSLLTNLNGEEIFGWRMLLTFPCLTVFIIARGYWGQIVTICQRLTQSIMFVVTRIFSAAMLSFQLWLFVWAPGNGHGLSVSLGYFIMPLTMVLIGKIAFQDRMTGYQKVACFSALLGILYQIGFSENIAWPTLAVGLGYPVYFWLRRKTDTNNIGGLWVDMVLSLPISIIFIYSGGEITSDILGNIDTLWLVIGLGVLSASALTFQALSGPHLNLTLFGLLVYVEPALLLVVALILGEEIKASEWPTYLAIWFSVFLLIAEGVTRLGINNKFRRRKNMHI